MKNYTDRSLLYPIDRLCYSDVTSHFKNNFVIMIERRIEIFANDLKASPVYFKHINLRISGRDDACHLSQCNGFVEHKF